MGALCRPGVGILMLTDDDNSTRGGLFSTPGDAYTTPVDMWVKAMGELTS